MGDMSKNCSKENVSPQKGETFSFLLTFHTCFRNKKTLMLWGFFPNFAATILSAN